MGRPLVSALFAALTLFLPGCIPLFYAYPSLSFIPPADLGPNHDHIYAFRVDIADDESGPEFAKPSHYTFLPLHIKPEGDVPLQLKAAVDSGFFLKGPLRYTKQTRHTVRLRLYRAGYETVEIKSWQFGHPIEWKAIADPEAREKAIDALIAPTGPSVYASLAHAPFSHLEPGSVSREHRQALLFAANEYDCLSRAITLEPSRREPLEAKARKLRELADL